MTELTQKTCEACSIGAPLASDEQIASYMPQIPQWEINNVDRIKQLSRTYKFSDFVTALAFTNQVGELAEAENHHPSILTEWGSVTVAWWSHKIRGIHVNDFIMAAKTDLCFAKNGY